MLGRIYEEGYIAFLSGLSRKDCPRRDDRQKAAWLSGFTDASKQLPLPLMIEDKDK